MKKIIHRTEQSMAAGFELLRKANEKQNKNNSTHKKISITLLKRKLEDE